MSIPISLLLNSPMNSEAASSSQAEGDLRGRSCKRRAEETHLTVTNVIQSQIQTEISSKRLKPIQVSSPQSETQHNLTPQQWIEKAGRYRRERDFQLVKQILAEALTLYPHNEDLIYYCADYAYLEGKFEKALEFLKQAPQSERCSTLRARIEKTRQDIRNPQPRQRKQWSILPSQKQVHPPQPEETNYLLFNPSQTSTPRRTQTPQEFMQEIKEHYEANQFIKVKASIDLALSFYPRDIGLVNFCTDALFLIGYPIEECLRVFRTLFQPLTSISTTSTTTNGAQSIQQETRAEPTISFSPSTSSSSYCTPLTPDYFLAQIKSLSSSQIEVQHCQPLIEQALKAYPKDGAIAYQTAEFFYLQGKLDQALNIINRFLLFVIHSPEKQKLTELRLKILNQQHRLNVSEKAIG